MNLQISIQPNLKLALRDPEGSALGRKIIREGIKLMHTLGYEQFTFKKLAEVIDSTEASIYRYFENKHRLLLYFLTWYWNYVEYQCMVSLHNLNDPAVKIKKIIEILTGSLPSWSDTSDIDKAALQEIVIAESSKAYLTKEVDDINSLQLFKPYKDLCRHIAQVFSEYNPQYPYTHLQILVVKNGIQKRWVNSWKVWYSLLSIKVKSTFMAAICLERGYLQSIRI
jgi:AcrR family transcriptional regulator